jgi:hypothetical protein
MVCSSAAGFAATESFPRRAALGRLKASAQMHLPNLSAWTADTANHLPELLLSMCLNNNNDRSSFFCQYGDSSLAASAKHGSSEI